jgi:Sec-independent protein translocase protein TatA
MSSSFEDRLDTVLNALNEAADNADRQPSEPELAELVQLAAALRAQPQPQPSAEGLQRGRARLLAELAQRAVQTQAPRGQGWSFSLFAQWRLALVAVVFIVLCGAGTLGAAANSLPGDWLYGVKLASEQIALTLTFDGRAHRQLEDAHTQKRLQEVDSLRALRRVARTQLEGDVQGVAPATLVMQGISLKVEPAALNQLTQLKAGERVKAVIQTDANGNATVIELLVIPTRVTPYTTDAAPTSGALVPTATTTRRPEPLSVATDTVAPTSTRAPESTATPAFTHTPAPAATATATSMPEPSQTPVPTRTPEPTRTPQTTPTFTPEPTRTPTRIPQAINTATLTPEPTEKPEPTDTPTLSPTRIPPTATGTPARAPTLTPTPVNATPTRVTTQTPIATTPKPTPITLPSATPIATSTQAPVTPVPSIRPTLERTPTTAASRAEH